MTRWVQAVTFCLTLLGAPALRLAAGSPGNGHADTRITTATAPCLAPTTDVCRDGTPRSLVKPELECSLCTASPLLTGAALTRAEQTVCRLLTALPLLPAVPACHAATLARASSGATVRL